MKTLADQYQMVDLCAALGIVRLSTVWRANAELRVSSPSVFLAKWECWELNRKRGKGAPGRPKAALLGL
jgi:hypothetical protein